MIYRFPNMAFENDFNNLAFVACYSDKMIAHTGDRDWGVVYEFPDDGLGHQSDAELDDFDDTIHPPKPPCAVLLRLNGQWARRSVKAANLVGEKWVVDFVEQTDVRTFDIRKTEAGWKLTMYEDGKEAGGGVGGPDDHDFLISQAYQFCGG